MLTSFQPSNYPLSRWLDLDKVDHKPILKFFLCQILISLLFNLSLCRYFSISFLQLLYRVILSYYAFIKFSFGVPFN